MAFRGVFYSSGLERDHSYLAGPIVPPHRGLRALDRDMLNPDQLAQCDKLHREIKSAHYKWQQAIRSSDRSLFSLGSLLSLFSLIPPVDSTIAGERYREYFNALLQYNQTCIPERAQIAATEVEATRDSPKASAKFTIPTGILVLGGIALAATGVGLAIEAGVLTVEGAVLAVVVAL
ncbi:MAG: hypothetical protein COV45_06625 [Deltaproteobacteria bacterium CG11_big_fil_rev_8_21_14_0_20_47_16]|nr:MAG: hypothetical protein COV45_06625 [Deltaproteobacteria bacterium CG11_big_fil_rev_8_21_14_0_20_47_16]